MTNKTAVVIPAYNEEKAVAKVIDGILALKQYDVVVVDDGSTDQTAILLKKYHDNIKIISFSINAGKGEALRAGCDYAYDMGYQNIVMMDGDGQHDVKDIDKMVDGLTNKNVEMIINRRILKFRSSTVSRFGRMVVRIVFNNLFQTNIRDHLSGFRVFKSAIYPIIRWEMNDYRVEVEMLVRAVINKIKYAEVESYCGRKTYKGMGWVSGLKILVSIWYYFFNKRLLRSL